MQKNNLTLMIAIVLIVLILVVGVMSYGKVSAKTTVGQTIAPAKTADTGGQAYTTAYVIDKSTAEAANNGG